MIRTRAAHRAGRSVWDAASDGDAGLIRVLALQDIPLDWRSEEGLAPIHQAARRGHAQCIAALLEAGAEVDLADECADEVEGGLHWIFEGSTALHWAVFHGHLDAVAVLLDRGAKVDALDRGLGTPLMAAAYRGHAAVARVLLDRGARVNLQDVHGRNSAYMSAEEGQVECLRLLVERGADLAAKDVDGRSALHRACDRRQSECVEAMLDGGADVHDRMEDHMTPLHIAAAMGDARLVRLLVERGAAVDARDGDAFTPLHHCVLATATEAAEVLLDRAGNVDLRGTDEMDMSPYDLAVSIGNTDAAALFLAYGCTLTPEAPPPWPALVASAVTIARRREAALSAASVRRVEAALLEAVEGRAGSPACPHRATGLLLGKSSAPPLLREANEAVAEAAGMARTAAAARVVWGLAAVQGGGAGEEGAAGAGGQGAAPPGGWPHLRTVTVDTVAHARAVASLLAVATSDAAERALSCVREARAAAAAPPRGGGGGGGLRAYAAVRCVGKWGAYISVADETRHITALGDDLLALQRERNRRALARLLPGGEVAALAAGAEPQQPQFHVFQAFGVNVFVPPGQAGGAAAAIAAAEAALLVGGGGGGGEGGGGGGGEQQGEGGAAAAQEEAQVGPPAAAAAEEEDAAAAGPAGAQQ